MILYKDDSKLSLKVITTVTGEKEYRRNCRFIKSQLYPNGNFYVMEKDCYHVAGQWHRVESGLIELDHEKGTWDLKTSRKLARGVVRIDDTGEVIMGMFTPNIYNNCKVNVKGLATICISENILKKTYIEDIGSNIWYLKKGLSAANLKVMRTIRNERNFLDKGYNIEDNVGEFDAKKTAYAEFPTKLSKEAKAYAKFLGESTFGGEIETSEGNIPSNIQHRLGLVSCRDGSIHSAEWVTVPMSGAKGVQNLIDVADVCSERCNIDINCSLHYHFGNTPKEREYLVALYILAYKIQDDIFKMFPYFKVDHRGYKKKNYCQKLKKMSIHPCKDFTKEGYDSYINEIYVRIFAFLSDGVAPGADVNRKRQQHPIVNKWDRKSRYYWLNLQNMIFSERETAEFRLHTGTTNKIKMIAWLFICNAIIKYAEVHLKDILVEEKKIPFKEVLMYYAEQFPKDKNAKLLSEYLVGYYDSRCELFAKDLEKGDKLSEHDLQSDKIFNYIHGDLKLL